MVFIARYRHTGGTKLNMPGILTVKTIEVTSANILVTVFSEIIVFVFFLKCLFLSCAAISLFSVFVWYFQIGPRPRRFSDWHDLLLSLKQVTSRQSNQLRVRPKGKVCDGTESMSC